MISDFVKYATLFSGLTEEEQNIIIKAMRLQHFAANETIYAEGDESTAFYLLGQGGVRLRIGSMVVATLGAGTTFGESGVFLAKKRAVSATATMPTDAWAITGSDLEQIIQEHPEIGVKLSRNFGSRIVQIEKYLVENRLRRNQAFRALTNEELAELAAHLQLIDIPAGQTLYEKGEVPHEFYIIEEGIVAFGEEEQEQAVGAGGVVGLVAMLDEDTPAQKFAVAQSDVVAWKLNRADLEEVSNKFPLFWQHLTAGAQESTQIADEDRAVDRLRALPLFNGLDEDTLRQIAKKLIIIRVASGAVIYKAGSQADRVHIIEEGKVELQWPRGTLELEEGDIFGEEAILSGEPHLETAVARQDSELWELAQEDLESLILAAPIVGLNLSRELSHKLHKLAEQESVARVTAPVPVPIPDASEPPSTQVMEPAASPTVVTAPAKAEERTGKADGFAVWFAGLSRGAKWRLVILALLLIWLLGVSLTFTVAHALSSSDASSTSNRGSAIAIASSNDMQPVAMALARRNATHTPVATATYTPFPTDTPTPTHTPTPTPTPTNTPTPTPTATPTNTPTPTPTNTPTPRPVRRLSVKSAPAATPTPATQYSLVEVRRLSPCENRGKHNIYVKVIDANGNGVDNVWVMQAPAGNPGEVLDKKLTEKKDYWLMSQEDGRVTLDMYKNAQYTVYISNDGSTPASTDFTQALHSGFTDESACPEGGGGNTLFHNSFSVIFRKNW